VAIIEIKGVIAQSSDVIEELLQYREDDGVKAIVLRIDSPGGGVGPSQEIYEEILKVRKEKKVVTSMGSVSASGGYYIACASDVIVANPGTITGSIGVLMQFSSFEELFKKIGIKGVTLKAGAYKDAGSPFREMTPEEKRLMQLVLDNVHNQFIQAVAKGRNLDPAKVTEVADGRIFTGEQAKEYGLVDKMGNLQDAIEEAARLGNISGKPNIIYPRRKRSLLDLLLREMASTLLDVLNEKGYELNYLVSPLKG
jgi:protease-4